MQTSKQAAMAAIVAVAAVTGQAHAQTKPVQGWTPPPTQEMDPAKRVPAPAQATSDERPAQAAASATDQAPAMDHRAPPLQGTVAHETQDAPEARSDWNGTRHAPYEGGRGGFFLGVKGGKGWVYDDVDQPAREINAGYRWQAGAVTLVGIEAARGRLGRTSHSGAPFPSVDYASIGVNARFNFGSGNPLYALVRAGYWSAEEDDFGMDVDGGYVGVGLGVDVNRHFNLALTYTNHVYFNEIYWDRNELHYDANRADTLMLGAEFRF